MEGEGSDSSVASAVVKEIKAAGGEAVEYSRDLSNESGARGAIRCAVEAFGKIDAIVHNAGLAIGGIPVEKDTRVSMDKLFNINPFAAWFLINEAWPLMMRQKYGRIVLIGSAAMYGYQGGMFYSAAKATYPSMARALTGESDPHNIKVNVVLPSGVTRLAEAMPDSEFSRWFMATMKPEYVSPVVAYLCHEQCALNGETLAVAGGRVARSLYAETKGIVKPGLSPEDVRDSLSQIMSADRLTPYPSYADSVTDLMGALGFKPTETVAPIAASRD
jgi:NAD(P)-dependent dehydrogenase (short-subunit alcohol dehydrogenase family)